MSSSLPGSPILQPPKSSSRRHRQAVVAHQAIVLPQMVVVRPFSSGRCRTLGGCRSLGRSRTLGLHCTSVRRNTSGRCRHRRQAIVRQTSKCLKSVRFVIYCAANRFIYLLLGKNNRKKT